MMAEGIDAEAEMDGLFAGDDVHQEQGDQTQTLTQEEAAEQAEGGSANLDVTGVAGEKVKKRVIRNPQPKLNADRLMGSRGLHTLEDSFKDWKSSGKGKEFEDLDVVMKKMEHWAHRLFPKLPFDGVLKVLADREGKKRTVQTHVKKIRLGMVDQVPQHLDEVQEETEAVERDVERYGEGGGEGDGEQPDLFNELLRSAGVEDVEAPPAVQVTERSVVTVSEEQKERMRKSKEMAERKRKERMGKETERARLEEEEEMEREMMGAEAASEWGREDPDPIKSNENEEGIHRVPDENVNKMLQESSQANQSETGNIESSQEKVVLNPPDTNQSDERSTGMNFINESENDIMDLDQMMEAMDED